MSGGAFNYTYNYLYTLAEYTKDLEIKRLLYDLGDLMYEEEWYQSGDTTYEDWDTARKAFKQKWFKDSREDRLKEIIESKLDETKRELIDMM